MRSSERSLVMPTIYSERSARGVPRDLSDFIRNASFPCVGAKAVLSQREIVTLETGLITSHEADFAIYAALRKFARAPRSPTALSSFACVFINEALNELSFERALWERLQALHDLDVQHGVAWDATVSRDPVSPLFSMSVAGVAYFIVGLHPAASRDARRFRRPAIVFNPHAQFEHLRDAGRYEKMQNVIRARELATQGDLNPMLADFGGKREAAQYSGRNVGANWKCPLRVKS